MNTEEETKQSNQIVEEPKKQAVPSFLQQTKAPQQQEQSRQNVESEEKKKEDRKVAFSQVNEPLSSKNQTLQEFTTQLRLLKDLRSQPSKKDELIKALDSLTQDPLFQQEFKSDEAYVQCWLEYALNVKDTDTVIRYMIEHQIGVRDPKVHLNLAFFFEKYRRDFKSAEAAYKKALELNVSEGFTRVILRKYQEFSGRMQERITRDIVQQIGEEQFKDKIKNKKRKFADAFPDLNSSDSSNDSKKRKVNAEISQYHETVVIYEEGIDYLKQSQPNYKELTVNEQSQKELEQRPLSWIAKQRLFNLTVDLGDQQDSEEQQKLQFSVDAEENLNDKRGNAEDRKEEEEIKQVDDQPQKQTLQVNSRDPPKAQQLEEKKIEDLIKQQQNNIQAQVLETIGEISLDGVSNGSALFNKSSSVLKHQSQFEEFKQGLDDSNIFKTANNSIDHDVICPQQKQQEERKNIDSKDQIKEQIANILQSLTLQNNEDTTAIKHGIFKLLETLDKSKDQQNQELNQKNQHQPVSIIPQPKSEEPIPSKLTNNPFTQITSQINNHQQMLPKQLESCIVPQVRKSISENKSFEDKKRFSGILMNLIDEGEKKRQSNQFYQESPVPPTKPSFLQNLFQGLQMPFTSRGVQQQQAEQENDSHNVSLFEATPIDNKFSKTLNKDYSQEMFMKKKTLSKGRNHFDQSNYEQDSQQQIMSPFGFISPMNNKSRARNSNIMQDCCGDVINMIIKPSNRESTNKYNTILPSQQCCQPSTNYSNVYSVFSNYTGKDTNQFSEITKNGFKPNNNHQRDSTDSQGQVFQECNNDFSQVNNQTNRTNENQSRLPSALKPSNVGSNAFEEANSRNGSKSVRFKNY